MQELEYPHGYLEKIKEQGVVEVARKKSQEALAALAPEALIALRELLDDPDPKVRFSAIKYILDKNVPTPLGQRTDEATVAVTESVSEDVREIREKLEAEYLKQRKD